MVKVNYIYSGLVVWGTVLGSADAFSQQSFVQSITSQQLIRSGQELFIYRCSGCHGIDGNGKGPASPMLNPKPRNLVSGSFKFRSTPSGTLPTVEDLIRTINQGVPGTSMPSFSNLTEKQKLSLTVYIRSLRPEFKDTKADQISIGLASPPADKFSKKALLLASALKGKKVFMEACMTCHGEQGIGNGPGSEGLIDGEEQPIVPANLTKRSIKSGPTARDIFRAISTGLDGTPMPSFVDVYDEPTRWDLTAYIMYLRGRAAGIYTEEDKLQ